MRGVIFQHVLYLEKEQEGLDTGSEIYRNIQYDNSIYICIYLKFMYNFDMSKYEWVYI